MNVETLFTKFQETREWRKLSDNSKRSYLVFMNHAQKDYFLITNRVSQITTTVADDLYEKLVITKGLSHANMFMKVMRRIWNVSKRAKLVSENPFTSMGLKKEEPREIIWSSEQYNMFVDYTWKNGYKSVSLLVRLCYELGQRPGDMIDLTLKNFNADLTEVKFVQQKTKKKMHLPVSEELKRYIKAYNDSDLLSNFSARILNGEYRNALKQLNFPPLQIRDLRRTTITEIMSNGGSDAEGQAVSGHINRAMLNTYAPANLLMAKAAMSRRQK